MEFFVSIITVTHNLVENNQVENFKLLQSLLSLQTFKNIEHIVIDKASTDGTIQLLEDYQNKGALKYYSGFDNGKFDAYNKGVELAKGKYIAFMTCNDFMHDITGIQDIVNAMETAEGDFSYSPSYCIHPNDFVFLFVPSIHNVFQVVPCPRQCMLFKKSVLTELKCFDTEFQYLADYDLMVRLVMNGYKGVFVNRNYVTYRFGSFLFENNEVGDDEAKRIFIKNYSNLYDLHDEDLLNRMVKYSDFPKELLDKLSVHFTGEDKEVFYTKCEQMHNIRMNASNNQQEGI